MTVQPPKFKRKLLPILQSYISLKEVLVITGMRRVGKSSLLKMIYEGLPTSNKLMLDIENPLDRGIFEEKDYNNIINNFSELGVDKTKKAYILLDEIQAFPEIVKPIKYLFDHHDIKFVVTGSSSFYLKNLFPESLAGRKIELELYPLDFDEFLYFKGETNDIQVSSDLQTIHKS